MISLELIEQDRSQKKKKFNENQIGMNSRIMLDHTAMNHKPQIEPIIGLSNRNISPRKVQFELDSPKIQTKNQIYSKVLKQQINLHQFQNSADTYRNQKKDQQNAKLYKKIYPYGKQNVNIKQGVLEKYKQNNYLSQSRMLQQFQQQAKRFRNTHISELKQSRLIESRHQKMKLRDTRKKVSKLLPSQKSQIQQIRGLYNKKVEQAKQAALHEKNMIRNLQNQLKQLKTDMQRSKSTRAKNIFDLRNHLERPSDYDSKYIDSLDRCEQIIRHKIPIVIYNNQVHDARQYFGNGDGSNLISIQRGGRNSQKSKQFNQILHVLRKNQQRMGILANCKSGNLLSFNRSSVYP